eukprot:scaffold1875_cov339-Prasinococcus_capsulatus_cf.AAC.17
MATPPRGRPRCEHRVLRGAQEAAATATGAQSTEEDINCTNPASRSSGGQRGNFGRSSVSLVCFGLGNDLPLARKRVIHITASAPYWAHVMRVGPHRRGSLDAGVLRPPLQGGPRTRLAAVWHLPIPSRSARRQAVISTAT